MFSEQPRPLRVRPCKAACSIEALDLDFPDRLQARPSLAGRSSSVAAPSLVDTASTGGAATKTASALRGPPCTRASISARPPHLYHPAPGRCRATAVLHEHTDMSDPQSVSPRHVPSVSASKRSPDRWRCARSQVRPRRGGISRRACHRWRGHAGVIYCNLLSNSRFRTRVQNCIVPMLSGSALLSA